MSRLLKEKRNKVGNDNIEKEIRKSIIANKLPVVATADHHHSRRAISKTVLHWRKNNAVVAASGSKSNKNTTNIKQKDEMFLFPTASEDSVEDDHHSQRGGGSRNKDSSGGGTTGNKRKGRGEQRGQKQARRKPSQMLLNEEMNVHSLTAIEKRCGRLQLRNNESRLSLCSTSSKTNNKSHGGGRSHVEASKPKNTMGRQHGRKKPSSQKENEEPTNVLSIYVLLTI